LRNASFRHAFNMNVRSRYNAAVMLSLARSFRNY
jgi:hypothetical protein